MFINENHDTELLRPLFALVEDPGIAGLKDTPKRDSR